MTPYYEIPSGDGVRVAQPLFPVEGQGSTPMSPLQFKIDIIGIKKAKELNRLWHSRLPIYESGFCLKAKICFADDPFCTCGYFSNISLFIVLVLYEMNSAEEIITRADMKIDYIFCPSVFNLSIMLNVNPCIKNSNFNE